MTARTVTRRNFLKTAAATGAACAVPLVVSGSALGLEARPARRATASRWGSSAPGWQAQGANIPQFMVLGDVQVVAVCDVDPARLVRGQEEGRGLLCQTPSRGKLCRPSPPSRTSAN